MRLLSADERGRLTLKSFSGQIPPYAILSHTWGADDAEVSFDDIVQGRPYRSKAGFAKINFCMQQSRKDDLNYFWVDTCCINKADAVELQTAITSMFRWYRDSKKCYVFLSDVPDARCGDDDGLSQLENSRWFTRGWTLQELIAPKIVEFYSRHSNFLGSKQSLVEIISQVTAIPELALMNRKDLSLFTVAERMSWVKYRYTTEPLDKVYCLFGIFGVSTFINYGEDLDSALSRLKDVIAARYRARELAGLEHNFASQDVTSRSIGRPESHRCETPPSRRMPDLAFERMDMRYKSVQRQYRSTCSWILHHPVYHDWIALRQLQNHRGLLWIRGKPGCGKSTMMKFLCAANQSPAGQSRPDVILFYFFNARGGRLEHTTLGMCRSLLHQLLDQVPALDRLFDRYGSHQNDDWDWTIDDLCAVLGDALVSVKDRRIKCFIDALDECDTDDIRASLWFFEDVGERALKVDVQLLVCFASRHYPTFDISYGLRLILEHEAGHSDDLIKYINGRLQAGLGSEANEIKAQVFEKSTGIFMWVVLVVNILNKEFERGLLPAVTKRLQEIPSDLSNLFRDIVQRDRENMADFRLSMQWTLFARRPLTPREYYIAMIAGLDPDDLPTWRNQTISLEFRDKRVLNTSKGLAEVTMMSHDSAVQFIHESVRDYLLKHGGLHKLFEDESNQELLECRCHETLKLICETYISTIDLTDASSSGQSQAANRAGGKRQKVDLCESFVFIKYAVENVFYHANEAAKSIPQDKFASGFDLKRYINIHSRIPSIDDEDYEAEVTLPYVLAAQGHSRMIRAVNGHTVAFERCAGRYGFPILAAWVNRDIECVHAFLPHCEKTVLQEQMDEIQFSRMFIPPDDSSFINMAITRGHDSLAVLCATSQPYQAWIRARIDELLCAATRYNCSKFVEMLIDSGADVNKHGESGHALSIAAGEGHERIVQILLRRGADANAGDQFPLHQAIRKGGEQIVRALINSGADVNKHGTNGDALSIAIEGRHDEIVRILLDGGANANGGLTNPLHRALWNGREQIIEALINSKADVNAQDGYALLIAIGRGRAKTVQLLLDRGADVNVGDPLPLHKATLEGHQRIVQALINSGADVNALQGGDTALSLAIKAGHQGIVQILLKHGADLERQGNHGSPLHHAISAGHERIAEILIEKGAKIQIERTSYGQTLYHAAVQGQTNVVRMLLEYGGNLRGALHAGTLQEAFHRGHIEIAQMLVDKGADVRNVNIDKGRSLQEASLRGDREVVRLLFDMGVDVNLKGGIHGNALLLASWKGHKSIVKMLLDKGANVNAKGGMLNTALQAASLVGHKDVVQLLLDHGADVNLRGGHWCSALQAASHRGDCGIVRMLLDRGADINMRGGHHGSALYAASTKGHEELVIMLLDRGADVNILVGSHGSALAGAHATGRQRIAQILRDRGAVDP